MVEVPTDRITEISTLRTRLTAERIAEVDKAYFSPKERADKINTMLELAQEEFDQPLTRWDYLCFSTEFIGQFAISFFSHDDIFVKTAKLLGKWLYNLHYFYPDKVYGPAEKGERK